MPSRSVWAMPRCSASASTPLEVALRDQLAPARVRRRRGRRAGRPAPGRARVACDAGRAPAGATARRPRIVDERRLGRFRRAAAAGSAARTPGLASRKISPSLTFATRCWPASIVRPPLASGPRTITAPRCICTSSISSAARPAHVELGADDVDRIRPRVDDPLRGLTMRDAHVRAAALQQHPAAVRVDVGHARAASPDPAPATIRRRNAARSRRSPWRARSRRRSRCR